MALLLGARLTGRRKSAELRRPGPPYDRHRYPPAHHCRRRQALSFGAARRPPIGLVAHAAGDIREADRRHGRGRRAKSGNRAGLDLLRPRQFVRRRRGRRAPQALHRRLLGRCAGARRARAHALLARQKTHRSAAVHLRQHHGRTGQLARRSEILPRMGVRRRAWTFDLPADVGQGDPAGDRHGRAFSRGANYSGSLREAGAGRRPALRGRRQPVRACALPEYFPQADAAYLRRGAPRQGDARRRSSRASSPRSARRGWPGARTIHRAKAPYPRCSRRRASRLRCLPQTDREWIFAKTAQTLYPALAD